MFRSPVFCFMLLLLLSTQEVQAEPLRRDLPPTNSGGDMDFSKLDAALNMPPTSYISPIKPVLTAKEKTALQLSKAFHDRNIPPVLTENGRVTYAFGMTMASVVCAPFMVSDIELQAGEFVNEVVLGDTARWKLTLARSGSPEAPHLIVKPMDAGLETMAVVTTDRRVYHLTLKSQPKGHMPYVGFVYPEDAQASLQQQIDNQRKKDSWEKADLPAKGNNVDLSKLVFNYDIKGSAPWKPVQVFHDGRQTFIRLPRTATQAEMPVLLVRRDGGDILVNYRVKDDTLVVDDVFQEAILLTGVGSSQKRVSVKRTK